MNTRHDHPPKSGLIREQDLKLIDYTTPKREHVYLPTNPTVIVNRTRLKSSRNKYLPKSSLPRTNHISLIHKPNIVPDSRLFSAPFPHPPRTPTIHRNKNSNPINPTTPSTISRDLTLLTQVPAIPTAAQIKSSQANQGKANQAPQPTHKRHTHQPTAFFG